MRLVTLLLPVTLAALACAPGAPAFTDADRSAIMAEKDAYRAAVMNGDPQGTARLYTDDALLMPAGDPAVQGKIAIVEYFRSLPPVSDFRFFGEDFIAAGDLVIVAGQYSLNLLPPGTDVAVADMGKYVEVWRRQDGNWKMAWDIWNSDRQPAQP